MEVISAGRGGERALSTIDRIENSIQRMLTLITPNKIFKFYTLAITDFGKSVWKRFVVPSNPLEQHIIVPVRPDGVVYGVGFLILRDDERVEMVAWLRNHYFAQIMRRVDSDAVNQWRGIERKEDFVACR